MKLYKHIVSIAGGALLMASVMALPAQAHKVVVSAYAEDTYIEGEIGFSSGDMAVETIVEVFDMEGNKLGETKTDEDGVFQYTPKQAIALEFRANLGQGHIATYQMEVDELPDIFSSEEGKAENKPIDKIDASTTTSEATASPAVGAAIDPALLQAMISQGVQSELKAFKSDIASAVRREVKPLYKEVAAYKEKNDLQSILGGLGYIFGLFGIGFYVAARRKQPNSNN